MNYKEMWNRLKEEIEGNKTSRVYYINPSLNYAEQECLNLMKKIENEQYTKSLTEAGY